MSLLDAGCRFTDRPVSGADLMDVMREAGTAVQRECTPRRRCGVPPSRPRSGRCLSRFGPYSPPVLERIAHGRVTNVRPQVALGGPDASRRRSDSPSAFLCSKELLPVHSPMR